MAHIQPKRGDVIIVRQTAATFSRSIRPGRPAVVVSSNDTNAASFYHTIVWLNAAEDARPGTFPYHTPVMCRVPSIAMCEQITTIHRDMIDEVVRTCTDEEMDGIDAALLGALALPEPAALPLLEDIEPYDTESAAEKTYLQQVIADNEAMIANLQNELNALRAEDTDLRTKLAEQSHVIEMQRKDLDHLERMGADAEPVPAQEPLISEVDLAVLRAERNIYAMITRELIKK